MLLNNSNLGKRIAALATKVELKAEYIVPTANYFFVARASETLKK